MLPRVSISGFITVFFVALIFSGTAYSLVIDFEDGSLDDWEVVVDVDLGDIGPPSWEIRDSQLGLDGKVLYQGSNIWGTAEDSCLMGTFLIYKAQEFDNFVLEVDVVAADNDGMGLVWGYEDTATHYRAIMINDRWPDVNTVVDGIPGPFLRIDKRVGNESPWYEGLKVMKDDYVPYAENQKLHWKLEVNGSNFTFTREDGVSISASDAPSTGYVGIQLYAQQAEFDNFTITPAGATAVRPDQKASTVWGAIKGE